MEISPAARAHHDQLFPGHVPTLAQTDPELIEHFDNFAFDEVRSHGDLDERTRLLTQLGAMIAAGAVRIGYPRTLNALRAIDTVAPAQP